MSRAAELRSKEEQIAMIHSTEKVKNKPKYFYVVTPCPFKLIYQREPCLVPGSERYKLIRYEEKHIHPVDFEIGNMSDPLVAV